MDVVLGMTSDSGLYIFYIFLLLDSVVKLLSREINLCQPYLIAQIFLDSRSQVHPPPVSVVMFARREHGAFFFLDGR